MPILEQVDPIREQNYPFVLPNSIEHPLILVFDTLDKVLLDLVPVARTLLKNSHFVLNRHMCFSKIDTFLLPSS